MMPHGDTAKESIFQNDIIRRLLKNGWRLGKAENYNREPALYPEDLLAFVTRLDSKKPPVQFTGQIHQAHLYLYNKQVK